MRRDSFKKLWPARRRLILLGGVTVLVLVAAIILVWPITDLIATHDVGSIRGAQRGLQLQMAREAVRAQLSTLVAGLFAAGALVYTARNFGLSLRSFRLTEQGQVTDRYTKAIEQLGSEKLDIRIGGIYALERIARDSAIDHPPVMAVLTAFIREHSHDKWAAPQTGSDNPIARTRPDIQAAITVIGRRNTALDRQQIDLIQANLSGADIRDANLAAATFFQAKLYQCNFLPGQLDLSRILRSEPKRGHPNTSEPA